MPPNEVMERLLADRKRDGSAYAALVPSRESTQYAKRKLRTRTGYRFDWIGPDRIRLPEKPEAPSAEHLRAVAEAAEDDTLLYAIRASDVDLVDKLAAGLLDLSESAAKVANSRASIALQGRPLLGRPPEAAGNPTDPTPQRRAKAPYGFEKAAMGKGDAVPLKRYRVRQPVESYKEHFSFANMRAFEATMADAAVATKTNGRLVASYDSDGIRPEPGSRLGGLGDLPDQVRVAYWRHYWVYDQLSPVMQATMRALVLQDRSVDGTVLSMEAFGGTLFPNIKDRATRKGISLGALRALGDQLVILRRRWREHSNSPEEHELSSDPRFIKGTAERAKA